ncbi:unnamed protein product [Nezara viridula]|uniref:Uncharacterized protein n=1 Tax=Nezara viridula TaxID=85310 RepID=A0A9P0H4P3_NEZVI|nr:unnamed protein product [Nezara viridula]
MQGIKQGGECFNGLPELLPKNLRKIEKKPKKTFRWNKRSHLLHDPRDAIYGLTRRDQVLIFRLRTEHNRLKAHLSVGLKLALVPSARAATYLKSELSWGPGGSYPGEELVSTFLDSLFVKEKFEGRDLHTGVRPAGNQQADCISLSHRQPLISQ